MRIRRALISVTDKTGIVDFAKALEKFGVEIISTGGTAKILKENGVKVKLIEEHTGFPEMMDGRVKTLHPKVHGGILARRDDSRHMEEAKAHGISPIDMVVVNLYQFRKTVEAGAPFEEIIENIDIGGPALIRSSAKNYRDVVVVTDPADYEMILKQLNGRKDVDLKTRELLSLKAFSMTADYDGDIESFLSRKFASEEVLRLKFTGGRPLRYGENWHQKAKIFAGKGSSLASAKQLQGKDMSYNNYLDAQSAVDAAGDLMDGTGAAIIKHTNPCGYAIGENAKEALENAWKGDPISAFGGVVAVTKPVDKDAAEFLKDKFVEIIIAPEFDADAIKILGAKKNLRLIGLGDFSQSGKNYRFLKGALLEQESDIGYAGKSEFKTVTKSGFPDVKKDLALFTCLACKHTKSNAVVIAREYRHGLYHVIGMGAGQPNRVTSLKIALEKAKENLKNMKLDGSEISKCVLASDSFFPFPDSIEEAAKNGIRFIVQPGGSVKDKEVIEACDRAGIAMVFTGRRMFKH